MKVVSSFPHAVRTIENAWIPMSDGTRLAARILLPEDAEARPVPAILEYMPYRKRDQSRGRDEPIHRYLAGHGYAAVRVDTRGTGDSDGVIRGEMLKQEQDDGVEIIAWLAAQPWCSGSVGMQGLSWGGFSALQVAARRPPALKAIIPVSAADDRYDASLHYTGGCLINEQLWVATFYMLCAIRSPDPAIVGDRWREMWRERLEANTPWLKDWLDHPAEDAFWDQGSVKVDYGAIQCPVLAVSGWADYLSKCVPSLIAKLKVPCRGLVGPWGHILPHLGEPGQPIGFLQECLRWYDRWLKGIDNGADREPLYRVWMQDALPPRIDGVARPGRWVAEAQWPSPRIAPRRWWLNADGLGPVQGARAALPHRSPVTVGLGALEWSSRPGMVGQTPRDQRSDDAQSLSFDSAPLDEAFEMLGGPVVTLRLSCDRPVAQIAVRLNDVAPDGVSTRVCFKVLNLTHRDGSRAPKPMVPGEETEIRVTLPDQAYRFAAGHRLRIAISTAYWPIAWPGPEPATITVVAGLSSLDIPVRPPSDLDAGLRDFPGPEQAPPVPMTVLKDATLLRRVDYDVLTGETAVRMEARGGFYGPGEVHRIDDIGTEITHAVAKRFTIRDGDPLSATGEGSQLYEMAREGWRTRIETNARMTCSAGAFHVTVEARAYEGDDLVHSRAWAFDRARDLV